MWHADVPENLSVLGIISVKYPLSLTVSIYKLAARYYRLRYKECAYGIGSTTTIHQLNGRDQQVFDGKINKIQLYQKTPF